jgi:O-antigen ligase
MAKRASSDLPWLGNGVGTFKSLTQIYRDFGSALVPEPPSTAVAVATEWGQPALVVLAGLTILLIVALLLGAVRRGRDSFFPSAAAAGVLVILGEAFCDSSLLNPTVQIIVAILIGLGVSQSVGRTPWSDDQITHSGHRS